MYLVMGFPVGDRDFDCAMEMMEAQQLGRLIGNSMSIPVCTSIGLAAMAASCECNRTPLGSSKNSRQCFAFPGCPTATCNVARRKGHNAAARHMAWAGLESEQNRKWPGRQTAL
jgi:hypothetical protein